MMYHRKSFTTFKDVFMIIIAAAVAILLIIAPQHNSCVSALTNVSSMADTTTTLPPTGPATYSASPTNSTVSTGATIYQGLLGSGGDSVSIRVINNTNTTVFVVSTSPSSLVQRQIPVLINALDATINTTSNVTSTTSAPNSTTLLVSNVSEATNDLVIQTVYIANDAKVSSPSTNESDSILLTPDPVVATSPGLTDEYNEVANQVPIVTLEEPVLAAKYPLMKLIKIPTTRLWNGKDLFAMKVSYSNGNCSSEVKTAVDDIIERANVEAIKTNFFSVTLQTLLRVSGSTKNDYVSIGPYMWPCDSYPTTCKPRWSSGTPGTCDTNLHMPWISCDLTGEKNPSVPSAALGDAQFSSYWTAMTDLVLAFYYTENTKYATRAADLTRKFFLDASTKMAPNMKYGQLWPGARNGSSSGIVEILKLVEVIDCIELLKLDPTIWTTADNTAMVTWARQLLAWYNTDPLGIQARDAKNNIALWWHQTMLSVSLFVGDATTANIITSRMATKVVAEQIASNGNLTQEVIRATSKQYTAYSLLAIARTATISQATRTRLWSNARIKAAVAMFTPYANGQTAWPYNDTQTTGYDWKFWGEWIKLSAVALNDTAYETAYIATKAAAARAFGVHPGAVYKPL